ncbi:MAG: Gfo/Idh/MocA family oxidoreductase [bacterium]|nr:Gfo/Idh/MocA family oxidoreductase [bacterium]
MIKIGIIGYGHWGPHLVRTFSNSPHSKVTGICDQDEGRLLEVAKKRPDIYTTRYVDDLIDKDRVDAVVVATPAKTHFSIIKQALENGIHVFSEKPLTTSGIECKELIELAETKNLILFVGHLFLYNEAVVRLKEMVDQGELGNICYIHSNRLNLGPIRTDVNALWDLASHDISIILELIGCTPTTVNCQGLAYLDDTIHDVCSLTLHFEPKCMAMVHVSWLDPNKTRLLTVVGEKKMAVFNDNEPFEKIRIYNKRVDTMPYSNSFDEFQYSFRYGDTIAPWLKQIEPLKAECDHFLSCIINDEKPKTDGNKGLEVVRILEAADISMHERGRCVELG